jgi:hypothetical protein
MWGLVLTAIGHKDALRLIAALTMMRSVQLFTRVPTRTALRQRFRASAKVWKKSFRRARWIQLASMSAGLLLIALVVLGVSLAGQERWAMLIALMSVGYPVRNLLQAQPHVNAWLFTILVQWLGVALLIPAHVHGWGVYEIAFLVGAREWGASMGALIWKVGTKPGSATAETAFKVAEIGPVTALRARQAFTYRLGKILLGAFLPGTGLLARTGRGFNLHHKLERRLPHHRPSFFAISLGSLGIAAAIILWFPRPALLVVAATFARLAAAAGAVLVWWPYLDQIIADADEDEDEDD